jgi:FkbM family methyltransferase
MKRLASRLAKRLGYHVSRDRGTFGGISVEIDGRIVIDVGAHLGDTVSELRSRFPRSKIHAFEPYPAFAQSLRERFAGDESVEIHELALSDRTGYLPLVTSDLNLSLTGPLKSSSLEATYLTVAIGTIDDFLAGQGIGSVGLLKIDAEGHDLAVLRGAESSLERGAVEVIVVEVMFIPLFDHQPLFNDIYMYLAGLDYQLFDIRQTKKASSGQSRYANAVFIRSRTRP